MPSISLRKSDPDAPLLGHPGNATRSRTVRNSLLLFKSTVDSPRAQHKYVSRTKKDNKWVYEYAGDAQHAKSQVGETPQSEVIKDTPNADVTGVSVQKLSSGDVDALRFYQSSHFTDFNDALRDPAAAAAKIGGLGAGKVAAMSKMSDKLSDAIGKTKTTQDIKIYRGISITPAMLKEGAVVSDKGFVSTTTDPLIANKFAKDSSKAKSGRIPVVLSTVLPKGSNALPVSRLAKDYGDDDDDDLLEENELLLHPDTSFKVLSVKNIGGTYHAAVQIVPKSSHQSVKRGPVRTIQSPAQSSETSLSGISNSQEFGKQKERHIKNVSHLKKILPNSTREDHERLANYHAGMAAVAHETYKRQGVNASSRQAKKESELHQSARDAHRSLANQGRKSFKHRGLPLRSGDAYSKSMSVLLLQKSDPDAPLLGPPRNAFLWQRAREMASMGRANPSFSDILQAYQLISLAPGFLSVSSLGKAAGDRGGHVVGTYPSGRAKYAPANGGPIGKTQSGKDVTASTKGKNPTFTAQDHKDAEALHRERGAKFPEGSSARSAGEKLAGIHKFLASNLERGSGTTSSGKKMPSTSDPVYHGLAKNSLETNVHHVLSAFPDYTRKDHLEIARKIAPTPRHRSGKGSGPKVAAAHFAAAGLVPENAKTRKSLSKGQGFPLPIDTDPLARVRAGYFDNKGARLNDKLSAMLDSCSPTPLPSKTIGHIAEALSDMGLASDVFNATTDALQGVLRETSTPGQAASVTAQVLQAVPDLSPVDRREVGYRIAFLHSLKASS